MVMVHRETLKMDLVVLSLRMDELDWCSIDEPSDEIAVVNLLNHKNAYASIVM